MRFGKLSSDELQECILNKLHKVREEVVLSAALGEDCAALKIQDDFVLISTDPITAKMPLDTLGSLAVDVACNDIISNGGEPVALVVTLIMPQNSCSDDISIIMQAAADRAKEINVEIAGGHTEFSDSVIRPVLNATAIGFAKRIIAKSALSSGDQIYITKSAAIEGTVILSQHSEKAFTNDDLKTLDEFKKDLSVINEGKILSGFMEVSTLHDITEGGVLGAVAEICQNVNLGAKIFEESIPLMPVTVKLCAEFNADPYRLISSGSLMFTGKNLDKAIGELEKNGIQATKIGEITNGREVLFIRKSGEKEKIVSQPDELFRVL